MKTYTNPNAPLNVSDTYKSEVASIEMERWCTENCVGAWLINSVDSVDFEFPTDARQFELYFWMPTVSFNV